MLEAYQNDVGTTITLDCQVDISAATAVKIRARKPDGSSVVWTGSVDSVTYIKYVTQANDLDVTGVWLLQGEVDSAVWSGHSTPIELLVKPLV